MKGRWMIWSRMNMITFMSLRGQDRILARDDAMPSPSFLIWLHSFYSLGSALSEHWFGCARAVPSALLCLCRLGTGHVSWCSLGPRIGSRCASALCEHWSCCARVVPSAVLCPLATTHIRMYTPLPPESDLAGTRLGPPAVDDERA